MLAKTECSDAQYHAIRDIVRRVEKSTPEFVEDSLYVKHKDEIMAKARKRVEEVLELQKKGLICTTGKFVPSVHYPPITQYPFHSQEEVMATYKNPEDGMFDIYVHIPFCAQHCSFCHYPGELGSCSALRQNQIKYLDHLEMEMDNYMKVLGVDKIKARAILFGGGTPSHMDPDLFERLMKFFTDRIDRTTVTQFNFDVDEVTLAAQALVADGVDAIFTPTDNTIMTAELSIYELLAQAGIPHYTGADSFALNGAFLGYGVDYANLGRATGDMIVKILVDGADPASTAVMTFDNGTATVNTETCAALGLDFEAVSEAFAPYCTKVQSITTAESFDDLG